MVCSMRYVGPLPHGFHMASFQKTKLNEKKKKKKIEKSPRNTKKKKRKLKQNNNQNKTN